MRYLLLIFLIAAACLLGPVPQREAKCQGWVCVGPCAGPGTCPGYGCVCVGYSTGVGQCVSQ